MLGLVGVLTATGMTGWPHPPPPHTPLLCFPASVYANQKTQTLLLMSRTGSRSCLAPFAKLDGHAAKRGPQGGGVC